jgi:hypothetical protein
VITNTGDFRQAGCAGTAQGANCFDRADSRFSTPSLSIGGLSPVPQVKVRTGPLCWASHPIGSVCLSWDDPQTYIGAMKNGVGSPVIGVRLWKIELPLANCNGGPTGNDSGWTSVGVFPLGSGAAGTADSPTLGVCTYYALSVRFVGPGGGTNEIETGRARR